MRNPPLSGLIGSALTAFVLAACSSGGTPQATSPPSTAECSAEECAKAFEPPISPLACGAGHENEIGTKCERVASGECRKVLRCAGKAPE